MQLNKTHPYCKIQYTLNLCQLLYKVGVKITINKITNIIQLRVMERYIHFLNTQISEHMEGSLLTRECIVKTFNIVTASL